MRFTLQTVALLALATLAFAQAKPCIHKPSPSSVSSISPSSILTASSSVSPSATSPVPTPVSSSVSSPVVSPAVPSCTVDAVVTAAGCHLSQFDTTCGATFYEADGITVIFEAHELSASDCINICDTTSVCALGSFDGITGICALFSRRVGAQATLVFVPGAVAFTYVDLSSQVDACPTYACPDPSVSQCCHGLGCADLTSPYGIGPV